MRIRGGSDRWIGRETEVWGDSEGCLKGEHVKRVGLGVARAQLRLEGFQREVVPAVAQRILNMISQ
jgi:hypothetical protein